SCHGLTLPLTSDPNEDRSGDIRGHWPTRTPALLGAKSSCLPGRFASSVARLTGRFQSSLHAAMPDVSRTERRPSYRRSVLDCSRRGSCPEPEPRPAVFAHLPE